MTEGQFYERKGGAERRFFACAGRAVSKVGQGVRRVRPFPASAPVWNGEGRARSEGENFFSRQPFRSLSGGDLRLCAGFTERQQYGDARRTHPADKHQTCLFLSWGWSNICAECRSPRAVSLCGSRGGSLPSGRLREGMPSPWRVEAETGRRRPELDSTGSEDVRRTEKAKEGLKVWRARESHGT